MLALPDEERAAAAEQDPAVRQMLERAAQTAPQELMDPHGRVSVKDPRYLYFKTSEVERARAPARCGDDRREAEDA